jgi:hypothetical protein
MILSSFVLSTSFDWPRESKPLPLERINDAPLRDGSFGPSQVYAGLELHATLRNGLHADDALNAVYRSIPPREALHTKEDEVRLQHKSIVTVLASSARTFVSRTFATPGGATLLEVHVFPSPSAADQFFNPTETPPDVAVRVTKVSPIAAIGDESWSFDESPSTIYIRDGRVVVCVSAGKAPADISQRDYCIALAQAVRFRLMVVSGLLSGGGTKSMRLTNGITVNYRQFDSTKLIALDELRKVGATWEASTDNGMRICRITKGDVRIDVCEYMSTFRVGTAVQLFPVAPFAYDGDLWLPLEPILAAIGLQSGTRV